PANRKSFVQAPAAFANDYAGKDLDAFLVAFDDLRVHAHRVTHGKRDVILPELFALDLVKQCLVHKLTFSFLIGPARRPRLRSISISTNPAAVRPFAGGPVPPATSRSPRDSRRAAPRELSSRGNPPAACIADIPATRG